MIYEGEREILREEAESQLRRSGLHLDEEPLLVKKWNRWARAILIMLGEPIPKYTPPTEEAVVTALILQGNTAAVRHIRNTGAQLHAQGQRIARQRAELTAKKNEMTTIWRTLVRVVAAEGDFGIPDMSLADELLRARRVLEDLYHGPDFDAMVAKVIERDRKEVGR